MARPVTKIDKQKRFLFVVDQKRFDLFQIVANYSHRGNVTAWIDDACSEKLQKDGYKEQLENLKKSSQ